jgi:hypothetical protein
VLNVQLVSQLLNRTRRLRTLKNKIGYDKIVENVSGIKVLQKCRRMRQMLMSQAKKSNKSRTKEKKKLKVNGKIQIFKFEIFGEKSTDIGNSWSLETFFNEKTLPKPLRTERQAPEAQPEKSNQRKAAEPHQGEP